MFIEGKIHVEPSSNGAKCFDRASVIKWNSLVGGYSNASMWMELTRSDVWVTGFISLVLFHHSIPPSLSLSLYSAAHPFVSSDRSQAWWYNFKHTKAKIMTANTTKGSKYKFYAYLWMPFCKCCMRTHNVNVTQNSEISESEINEMNSTRNVSHKTFSLFTRYSSLFLLSQCTQPWYWLVLWIEIAVATLSSSP